MKKILTSLFILIITTLIIYSCTNNDSNENSKNSEFEKFKVLGKKHNEALNYFIAKVKKTPKRELEELKSIEGITSNVNEFVIQDNILKSHSNITNKSCKETCVKMYGKKLSKTNKTSLNSNLTDVFTNTNANEYIDKISNFDKYTNYINYQKKIDNLMLDLSRDNTITESDKSIIYTVAAIGYFSSEYWETEGYKWMSTKPNNTTNKALPKDFWKNFTKADVSGAIGAAIAGAEIGGITVPIIGAIPGAVVGAAAGGIGSSIAWGTTELLFD